MKTKLLLLAILVVVIVVSVTTMVLLLTFLTNASGKFVSTSALDSKLGGNWVVVNEGRISDPTGVSPIIEMLSNSSTETLYSSYHSSNANLTILVFQYQSASRLPEVVNSIAKIYRVLNWSIKNVTGEVNGICVSSAHYQYLYAYYRNYVILVVLNGTVTPSESMEIAVLQQQALG
ncbi:MULTISPECIES: hypothetical protein [Metallosphaera]|uniref:Uncharacterized protein n=3 Tax=Metallosphaera TaxID=41980 RepID=A4YDQ5_METS5|nr:MULTISPECIES: hypothetical protein [Metallosphaera]ABP94557.1 hypothetical protein Msed_0380 [Metallosphaera sedula DSM 5348]AIM26544.1 hypothetical protein HA72_0380 [Metallosphaera sedula]AKV73532.1 hypothetical protein MsedA_0393 [Metallosphaera sedula]AKV75774.1 hypothetical protein MsedB_0393 [Metallosphaera sedula]AKV78021.1 hypothetical protein MsedC_0392 [Metallosphaera sedula]